MPGGGAYLTEAYFPQVSHGPSNIAEIGGGFSALLLPPTEPTRISPSFSDNE